MAARRLLGHRLLGCEHGLIHDGLQTDGYIDLRIDWKSIVGTVDPTSKTPTEYEHHVALIRVNPWLAYGCGEGARLMLRKPGASEGTACTVQRALRDDQVVVRRDGTDMDLTVDPTPFTVVVSSNTRHRTGTKLLLVHENASVDVCASQPTGVAPHTCCRCTRASAHRNTHTHTHTHTHARTHAHTHAHVRLPVPSHRPWWSRGTRRRSITRRDLGTFSP